MKVDMMEQLLQCYVEQRLASAGKPCVQAQMAVVKCADEIDGVTPDISFTEIAGKLVKIADEFQKEHGKQCRESVENTDGAGAVESGQQNYSQAEVRRFSISKIASNVSSSATPETFKNALKLVCKHATSVPLEVALALELSAQLYKLIGRENALFVQHEMAEYFHDRVELENLENIIDS